MRILLAEDELQLSNVYKAAISHQGYEVDTAYNGQEAVDLAAKNAYDVMIMDIMMPIKTGLEALREIRATGDQTHVIMLTAMAEIDDRVNGLDAGADDYLTKPISLKELLARLRSLERRVEVAFTQNLLEHGKVKLNVSEQELSANNSIRLAGKETKLMSFFMLNKGKQLSTADIYKHVWAGDEDSDERLVYIYVSYLRQKLQAIQADLTIEGEEDGDFTLVQIQKED
ncbi:response regulator transcription factor [Streptococcus loxodontisalivarius]|uniref:DNA-binding response OmpR family regulator n=1 Tax=Streptococcus loxodontisalivarius TaxID=1349415 RepID=A0ABS2PS82_9STRE|nr:response regulator transcription factor [Streptococcus loxodontisalivarius]MBM7642901.1 DNA-binding response OmpR family regulator [Streptococcus loxodontisalivarius]